MVCYFTVLHVISIQYIHRKDDLEFWTINELLLEPCCALKYFPDIEVSGNKGDTYSVFLHLFNKRQM